LSAQKSTHLKLRRTENDGGVDGFLLLRRQMCCRPSTAKKGKDAAPAHFQHIGFDSRQLNHFRSLEDI